MTLRLYDTARQAVVPFEPGPNVTMYTCGITPYDATHLGHAATFIAYDVLIRRLVDLGHTVQCVRNVTDVDDPLFAKARQLGVHVLDRGFAYQAGGSVYFDVTKSPDFGSVSNYSAEQMLAFARERGGHVDDPHKRHPLDFVLWHPSAADEPSWDSLWGPGRPGWHIECSALALRELGTTIDLHGGGSDLIFPHHECERAQSEAATGEPFVKHWMHVAMVAKDGHKMSKSLGNLVFVDALRTEWDPRAIRLAIIEHHYRVEWEWDDGLMPRNAERLARWQSSVGVADGGSLLDEVRARLDDDLDTPGALACIDRAASTCDVSAAAALVGVRLSSAA
jgi:L-cysteine:1D-myo-inositol 2-amino-2-deoxy-alpha-D-glucopyranoside ligase